MDMLVLSIRSGRAIRQQFAKLLPLSVGRGDADGGKIDDLNKSLEIISDSLADKSLFFRAIDLSGTWRLGAGDFDPWNSNNVAAWAKLAGQATALPDLRAWLEDLERLLARHIREMHDPMWEADEVLVGEVPLSILAVAHLEFVPIYTRFLDVWENANAPQQNSIVTEIVQAHGSCSEVEDLLLKFVAYKGGDSDLIEYALRPELEKLYGDFPRSKLFRRMIETMHARGPELQDSTGKRYIFSYMLNWSELAEAAQAILAELDSGLPHNF